MSFKDSFPQSLIEGDEELEKLIEALDEELKTTQSRNMEEFFDIHQMSEATIDKWLKALGWKQNWQIDKRRLLKILLLLYRMGGTNQGIIRAVKEFAGIDVAKIYEAWPEAYSKGQTISDDEKCVATVYLSNSPYGEQTLSLLPLAEKICRFFKPGHVIMQVTVIRNKNQDVSYTIETFSKKTIRYLTYTPLS